MTIHWRSQAACRDSDPAVFFPGDKTGLGAVRRLCGGCPVQAACLTDAITGRDFYGFRGGHTGDERKALRKSSKAALKADQTAEIIRLGGKRWTAQAIALRLGTDDFVVYRVLKAHREAGAA